MSFIRKLYKLYPWIFLLSISIYSYTALSQHNPDNISIPTGNGAGSVIGDIVKAGDYFCAYSLDKVIIYNSEGNFESEVPFNLEKDYGKFNPFYFWDSKYTNSTKLMAYNETANVLYAVAPDLKIYIIDFNTGDSLSIIDKYEPVTPPGEPSLLHFKPLHGNCILKYDKHHYRLFWVIDGRNQLENGVGSFHVRQRYFFIFDINNNDEGKISSRIYADHEYSNTANYSTAGILDLEVNEINHQTDPDYFYLSKISRLEVWGISKDPIPVVSIIDTLEIQNNYQCGYYKTMLKYINDQTNGIHRIIAYPYKFPGCGPLYEPDIFVLDGNHSTDSIVWNDYPAPNGKITDAAYLEYYQHLVFSHPADPLNTVTGFNPDHDLSIYLLSSTSNNLSLYDTLGTNESGNLPTQKDFNTPISIIPFTKSTLALCKEDEISYLYQDSTGYKSSSILKSENNFFYKGVSIDNGTKAIVNLANNGIQFLDNNLSPTDHAEAGFQANHICMDNDGDKFYIYNKLNNYHTGCLVYNGDSVVNLNNNLNQPIEAPVGDCIYNPFLDHFLISENASFDDRAASVKVFLNNAGNTITMSIPLEDLPLYSSSFARDMFISPAGKLYIMADMNCNALSNPKVYIFDATDNTYPLLSVCPMNSLNHSGDYLEFYKAYFCYNHHNNRVYATINPQHYVMSPYNASSNGLIRHFQNNSGLFIEFDNTNSISATIPLTGPGKIICPDYPNMNTPSRYGENMFIIGANCMYEISPPYNSFNDHVTTYMGEDHMDITYSPHHDMLFVLNDSPEHPINAPRHRVIRAFSLDYDHSGDLDFTEVLKEDGQAVCILANPYNGEIYVHQKTDQHKLGGTPVSLLYFEYDSTIVPPNLQNVQSVSLGINSLYPEIDHNNDNVFNFYLYNITSPAINPYTNSIYLPNGAHSCISKVSFDANEKLVLNPNGITWLSIPRHLRPNGNPTPIDDVFDPGNISGTIQNLTIEYNFLNEDMGAGEQNIISSIWLQGAQPPWTIHEDNEYVYSTRGYIVEHSPNEQKTLTMEGTVESPGAGIDIYCKKDNWVGYFLYEEQSVFDALADVVDDLYHIKGQDFNCYRYHYPISTNCGLKSEKDYSPGTWICNARPNIKYGDMIMVKPEEDAWFQWNYSGNLPSNMDVPQPEHFEFEEKATYTTLVLELDTTTANPIEIGAFVNDTCVGACTVNELDSVVVLSAYTYDKPGDSVTFEQYFASGKSSNAVIRDYFVLNNKTRQKEKRAVLTGEKQDIFIISFRDEMMEEEQSNEQEFYVHLYPNPASSIVHIEYNLHQNAFVRIVLSDVTGKRMAELLNIHKPKGTHTHSCNIKFIDGQQLEKGVYFVQLSAGEKSKVVKLIVYQ